MIPKLTGFGAVSLLFREPNRDLCAEHTSAAVRAWMSSPRLKAFDQFFSPAPEACGEDAQSSACDSPRPRGSGQPPRGHEEERNSRAQLRVRTGTACGSVRVGKAARSGQVWVEGRCAALVGSGSRDAGSGLQVGVGPVWVSCWRHSPYTPSVSVALRCRDRAQETVCRSSSRSCPCAPGVRPSFSNRMRASCCGEASAKGSPASSWARASSSAIARSAAP